ncbi:MAG: histidine phosphatase family protein [Ruminococcus sp.]|nr:histidine phosphatase family protein [Ruminococcus sp.]
MKLFVTRHGETEYNKKDLILGTTDVPMNFTGAEQAMRLAGTLKKMGKVDIIYCSPLSRAKETAQQANSMTLAPVKYDNRLREWDYGEFEGQPRNAEGFTENKKEFAAPMGHTGEPLLHLSHRVYSLLDEVIANYGKTDKNVLLVTHNGVCRVIETYFHYMTNTEFDSWSMDNCQVIEYDID